MQAQRASARALGKGGAGAGLYRSSYIYTHLHRLAQGGGRGTIGHHVYCTPIIKKSFWFVNVMKLTIVRALKR